MTEREFEALLPALITMTCLLCCCCTVLIGGGLGAFFYFRRKNSGGAAPAAAPADFAPPVMSGVPSMGGVEATPAEAAPTPFGAEAMPSPFGAEAVPTPFGGPAASELPGPATPIDPDDIRAKLLGLNGPDQPYAVQATGYKIVIAPTAITGYLLEVAFDFVERVARFVETNPALADPRLKHDARQVLEANGWTVRE